MRKALSDTGAPDYSPSAAFTHPVSLSDPRHLVREWNWGVPRQYQYLYYMVTNQW
jgi:hypothetical protein